MQKSKEEVVILAHFTPLGSSVSINLPNSQNISKHVGVMVCTSSTPKDSLRGKNYERQKARFVNHAMTSLLIHTYTPIKRYRNISKGIGVM